MEKISSWIEDRDCNGKSSWMCSNCGVTWEFEGFATPFSNEMHYCPKCGSKMIDEKFVEVDYGQ